MSRATPSISAALLARTAQAWCLPFVAHLARPQPSDHPSPPGIRPQSA